MSYAPCKDCKDRRVGCHAECEKYARFYAENEARKEAYRKDRQAMNWGGNAVAPRRDRAFSVR